MIAFGKLQELITGSADDLPAASSSSTGALFVVALVLRVYLATGHDEPAGADRRDGRLALVLGVLMVLPIGGADMPVVISLLNAYTGLAAAATGFVLGNNVLIIAGALDGASGFAAHA